MRCVPSRVNECVLTLFCDGACLSRLLDTRTLRASTDEEREWVEAQWPTTRERTNQ